MLGHTLTWFRKLRASLRSHVTLVLSTLLPRAARVRPDAIVPAMPVNVEAWSGAFLLPNLHRRRPTCTAHGQGKEEAKPHADHAHPRCLHKAWTTSPAPQLLPPLEMWQRGSATEMVVSGMPGVQNSEVFIRCLVTKASATAHVQS